MPNGTYGGVRGRRKSSLLDFIVHLAIILNGLYELIKQDIGAFASYFYIKVEKNRQICYNQL